MTAFTCTSMWGRLLVHPHVQRAAVDAGGGAALRRGSLAWEINGTGAPWALVGLAASCSSIHLPEDTEG
jgi:hypothetical protein